MSRRNRETRKSRVESRRLRARHSARLHTPRDRRGVLLLVVLSLLVLFMLIGTAFLMSSNQYKSSADASSKLNRVGNFPTELLDRALMQVLCDTGNPHSVIRSHSLLRDFYGSEGFEAVIYSPRDTDLSASFAQPAQQVTRYATEPTGPYNNSPKSPDPTRRQLIDIYVRELAYKSNDVLTPAPINEGSGAYALTSPDARHVLKLERSAIGLPEMYNMPLTKGYFNGCVLTVTSGPAAGQSTRIVDYQYVGDLPTETVTDSSPFPTKRVTRLFRLRVLAFPNAAGGPLLTRSEFPTTDSRYRAAGDPRALEIADLADATFIVNGRPFSGTGAGFNELAKAGEPRLNALETVGIVPDQNQWMYPPIALMPNAAFFFTSDPNNDIAANDLWGARYFDPTKTPPNQYPALNPLVLPPAPNQPNVNLRPTLWKYPTFVGPGDADESYDAADFQNMFLALQTVTPRPRGRVVVGDPNAPVTLQVDAFNSAQSFLRLDLEDLPIPSFHRPDLINYWYHQLLNAPFLVDAIPNIDQRARAILGDANYLDTLDPAVAGQIAAMKRKFILRPLHEDHPAFDGSNSASLTTVDFSARRGGGFTRNNRLAVPYWEAVGPWDVDNDGDGVPDSVWVDLGDPVQQAEDGTLYKPLYAFLVIDLDSRLNVNAHGLVDHLYSPTLDANLASGGAGNLAHDTALTLAGIPSLRTSNLLPSGSGYGPAEISLRPILSPNLPGHPTLAANLGNTGLPNLYDAQNSAINADDYARLLVGRRGDDRNPTVWGRHGLDPNPDLTSPFPFKATPGITSILPTAPQPTIGPPGIQTQFKFFGYPWMVSNYAIASTVRTAFSSAPDLMSRYAVGLDYAGQPVVEMTGESSNRPLLAGSPYELDLSGDRRREVRTDHLSMRVNATDPLAITTEYVNIATSAIVKSSLGVATENDDAPFATAELERILRAYDADSGILPDRLWNVVDAFDPLKLVANQPALVASRAQGTFGSNPGDAELLATAQQLASVNRRLVTTDSYDVPVPGANLLARLAYGADGQPGRAGFDDDDDDIVDNAAELGWQNSDDWYPVMHRYLIGTSPPPFNGSGAPTPPPGIRILPQNPTIVDLLKYRIQLERWRQGGPNDDYSEQQLSYAVQYMLPPEVIAGKRMDLNRPFGDGRDNGDGEDNDGNGIVDEPEEAGEPFVDENGNGRRDSGEYFYNLLGGNGELTADDNLYNGPRDQLWQGLTSEPIAFDYGHGGDVTDGRLIDLPGGRQGRLRNNGLIQRQTFARQLYCLMMLLVDENYLASENIRPDFPAEGGVFDIKFLDENGDFDILLLQQQLAQDIAIQQLYDLGLLTPTTDTSTQAFKELLGAAVNGEPFTDGNNNGRYDNGEAYTDLIPNGEYDWGAKPTAYGWILRKLTARKVAQWAVNVLDYRDADSIMTPFEYDENPFDGWGVFIDSQQPWSPTNFIPLDGDVATNENWGRDLPVPRKFNPFLAVQNDPNLPNYNPPFNDIATARVDGTRELATREVVWGAERPELLITETLAIHDRRATDEADPAGLPPHRALNDPPGDASIPPDFDLDQKLKPRGSLFVELYNPWSPDGERPPEFYDRFQYGPESEQLTAPGVMLNKLSEIGVQVTDVMTKLPVYKRSPVWRMTVLYEPFSGKLSTRVLDSTKPLPLLREDAAQQALTANPDGFSIEMDKDAERFVYFTTGDDYRTFTNKFDPANRTGDESDPNRQDDLRIRTTLADERAEYFQTTIGTQQYYAPKADQFNVHIPPIGIREATIPSGGTNITRPFPTARRYFIARTERWINGGANDDFPANNDRDIPIAPILPGRYAVVGSSGLQLYDDPGINRVEASGRSTLVAVNNDVTTRFVTPLSRLNVSDSDEQTNEQHLRSLFQTRRIELWPFAHIVTPGPQIEGDPRNWADPTTRQQLLVAENGGAEFIRFAGDAVNVTDSERPATDPVLGTPDPPGYGVPDAAVTAPAVAIPIEDLNISEPVEGYPSLLYRRLYAENAESGAALTIDEPPIDKITAEGEVEYNPTYDRPLDMEEATLKNGTTPNYRSIHLQRLANPLLPWNPPPVDRRGNENPMHRPGLPVNPYLTIDSQSADLTAYNGASQLERSNLPARTPDGQTLAGTEADAWQGNFFAPLTAQELLDAPDHVLWALIYMLKQQDFNANPPQTAIVSPRVWYTPAEIRAQIENTPDQVNAHLRNLAQQKGILSADASLRDNDILNESRSAASAGDLPPYPRNGIWGAHLFRRILPDDSLSGTPSNTGEYRQTFHLKSMERGSHNAEYVGAGWKYDSRWKPRLLWKQERPNAKLFLKGGPSGYVEASDLSNAKSKRVLAGGNSLEHLLNLGADPADETARNLAAWSRIRAGSSATTNDHVVDFVLDQTLGFINAAYAPELDRQDGFDENALLLAGTPRPGAPQVAVADRGSDKEPVAPLDKVPVSPRRPSVATQADVLRKRQELMNSTFPWLSWNNRPFTSSLEILQVPAWSSSRMLHEYTVGGDTTANGYDGSVLDDGLTIAADGVRVTTHRYQRERGTYGHVLNFFNANAMPAVDNRDPDGLPESRVGSANYYRILDFVEVPSRYVGTQTMFSPEIFNDLPVLPGFPTEPVGTDLTSTDDPRYAFQPPFNFVSRERDPGRVNLNTITGRRQTEIGGFIRHWSEVYDGIMHRYGDSNLMDSTVTAGNPPIALQLSHFGPAWRDVALSRRGYAQYNADGGTGPVEKVVDDQNQPDVFPFGLNADFPTVFTNPFRSADAGDLVPLANMVRPGVEATILRGLHWQRAFEPDPPSDNVLITNPFASRTIEYSHIAWGVAGFDDDGNGVVDDIREAGYGIIESPPTVDGDTLRVRPSLNNALEGSGIPLFSEQVPEPAIDGERNPGMMYQPMTRLGNLVTTRSNVYAVWVTVGYFEVHRAPDWLETRDLDNNGRPDGPDTQRRFGGDGSGTAANPTPNPQSVRARALYDRVYPEGYTLGEELGTDTGNTRRQRAFYIIDRTEPVGFKPGEDLNAEKAIRVRRRIE